MKLGGRTTLLAGLVALAAPMLGAATADDQSELAPVTEIRGDALRFDWPAVQIGIGSYEEGPTGLTILHFPAGASAAVDVRGGSPGTVNTDALRLASPGRFVDAIAISGGSTFGEEAIASVATGLKARRLAKGRGGRTDFVAGAIIYDFNAHRLNEIYPDKRLAWAALGALRPGVFPLGAQGAGRAALQGSFLGCRSYSGQGGAFRQVGQVKIAAFTVVNALGAVVDRDGRLARCARHPAWGADEKAHQVLARLGSGSIHVPAGRTGPTENTTISVIVTNKKLTPAELNRLAVQVHGSMARAIQPFSTFADGDTLFAVSTQEVDADEPRPGILNAIAGELMWDAVLASIPPASAPLPAGNHTVAAEALRRLAGRYRFGPEAVIDVSVAGDRLRVRSTAPDFFDLPKDRAIDLQSISPTEFFVSGRYRTRLSFRLDRGRVVEAIVNPGRWAQRGVPER